MRLGSLLNLKERLDTIDSRALAAATAAAAAVVASTIAVEAVDKETEITDHHFHPDLSVTTPNGRLRVGALSFNSAPADGETITLGKTGGSSIVYTFKTTLTNPANAGNVYIKVQASAILAAQKLMYAVAGVSQDTANIKYYNDVAAAHPDFVAPYTAIQVAVGTALHSAGATVVFIAKVGDSIAACTLSNTLGDTGGTYKLTAFTRIYSQRYVMAGNATPATNSIAGSYQCICPMSSVWHPTEGVLVSYDVGKIVVEACSDDAMIVECDGFFSVDEVTFTPLWYGLELSRTPTVKGSQMFPVNSHRIPPGAGFYVKMRSNLTSAAEWLDFKAQYHLYPSLLSD